MSVQGNWTEKASDLNPYNQLQLDCHSNLRILVMQVDAWRRDSEDLVN